MRIPFNLVKQFISEFEHLSHNVLDIEAKADLTRVFDPIKQARGTQLDKSHERLCKIYEAQQDDGSFFRRSTTTADTKRWIDSMLVAGNKLPFEHYEGKILLMQAVEDQFSVWDGV